MSNTYKRIAALRPTTTDEQTLYSLTSGSIVGIVYICNQDITARTYRLALTDAATGESASGEDWLAYDISVQANTTHSFNIPGMLATATLRVKVDAVDVMSFIFMGVLKI